MIAFAGWLAACTAPTSPSSTADTATVALPDPESLAALGVMIWDGQDVVYEEGVEPYTLATPLFSDYAVKRRAVRLPEGTTATYTDNAILEFPVGTTIVKTFLFPADLRAPDDDLRIVETRVLTLEADGWDAWPYVWSEDGSEAYRAPSGDVVDVTFVGLDGATVTFPYLVPQRNQCVDCHELSGSDGRTKVPIGPKARHLNVDGQIERLVDHGWLAGAPPIGEVPAAVDARTWAGVDPATLSDEEVTLAARDYLDINCAHCHNPAGEEGRSSQLFLNWDNADMFSVGVCKRPGSAGAGTGGLTFDIVPGQPEQSILVYRLQTATIGEMMPDIGRYLVDTPGVAIVSEWVRRLEGTCSE